MKSSSPSSLTHITNRPAIHHIGRFKFSDKQLEYVLVNSVHARGTNTTREVLLVLQYKWPRQFQLFLESDLQMVSQWLRPGFEARKSVTLQGARFVEGLNDHRPNCEAGGIGKYMYGQPLVPEGGWYQEFERQCYATRLPVVTQLVNTFKIELREAEVYKVRALAKKIEPEIVRIILTNKLFSNLSSVDIALGLTNRYSRSVSGCRYVWMFPFTKIHVESVWYHSQVAQTETFKTIVGMDRQDLDLRRLLMAFMQNVEAGRADEMAGLDPRSCGNQTSAASLVEEVHRIFLAYAASKDFLQYIDGLTSNAWSQ